MEKLRIFRLEDNAVVMGAAEKVPCPRGGKGVWETHIAEGTAEDFERGTYRWSKLSAC